MRFVLPHVRILNAGFLCIDIIAARLPKIPDPGEIVYAPAEIKLRIGGHPANVSIDLIQLGVKRGEVGIICAVGEDYLKNFAIRTLESRGIVTFIQEIEGVETSKTVVIVVEGEDRRYINDPGANMRLRFNHVLEVLKEVRPRIFYIASGLLGDLDFRVWELLKLCKESGVITVIDLVNPVGKDWSYIHPALKFTDMMHCNTLELRGISGEPEIEDGIRWLAEKGVKLPVISDGEKGVISLFQDHIIRQPAFKVKAVDPTGAGDALCAGIIFKLSELIRSEKSLEDLSPEVIPELLIYGQAAGAACIGEIGTTPGVTADRVRRLINEQGEKVLSATSIKPI